MRRAIYSALVLYDANSDRDTGARTLDDRALALARRLDQVQWTRAHTLFVLALGSSWLLDGLEISLLGAIAAVLTRPDVMGLSAAMIGLVSSFYLVGAVIGSISLGYLSDRYGRRSFFFVSLGAYLVGITLTALAMGFFSLALSRFVTGFGIGGEYSAVNSAIDELIPARVRGQVDLAINGSFWLGAAVAGALCLIVLDPTRLSPNIGWRLGFALGPILGTFILLLRRHIPESPRWLARRGRCDEAEEIVRNLEQSANTTVGLVEPQNYRHKSENNSHSEVKGRFSLALRQIFRRYRRRAILGFGLMAAQAFLYNAIFFTYALVLHRYYAFDSSTIGSMLIPFALGNFCGPLALGRLFDVVGRRRMIAGSYAISALILLASGWLFVQQELDGFGQIGLWVLMFFFASAAASAAYLTVSELFPIDIRALAIAVFFSLGTAIGGIVAPSLFGLLIDTGSRTKLFGGYALASGLMMAAAILEWLIGVDAERRSLEELTI